MTWRLLFQEGHSKPESKPQVNGFGVIVGKRSAPQASWDQ
jgi:hypothetical protein